MLPTAMPSADACSVGPCLYNKIITSRACVYGNIVDSRTVSETGICYFVSDDHKVDININIKGEGLLRLCLL